ncbi:MAG TPA: M14 family metallopeptidase [Verrucomicrobiae bacterium]|nr:M14 family metallopeptidase [Verrucomicrobiae bacterium]
MLPRVSLFYFWLVGLLWMLSGWGLVGAEPAYLDHKTLTRDARALARSHPAIVHLESACVTTQKNDVWRLELGSGPEAERRVRPAMLIVAGIEGNDQVGPVSVMRWLETLAGGYQGDDRIKHLLDTTTVYAWPRVNPDAAGHFFAKPRVEIATNDKPVDDDHDGLVDEDGPEDLNGDGLITWMRVEDPEGEYMLDPVDARLLLKADRFKGERGGWQLWTEGRDNDGDKRWNEDGPGGVNFNRNFPYGYRFFATDAGRHPISEVETRALADFVIAHPNIAVAFTFGAADNLVQTPKGEAPKRPPTALHEEDLAWYRELGKSWRETLGLKKELSASTEPGTFSDWIYFHRGRLSLAARPWSPALQLELAKTQGTDAKPKDDAPRKEAAPDDSTKRDQAKDKSADKPKETDNRNEEDRAFLKWIDQHATNLFVPWKKFDHPDFPTQTVEIGGFAPYARTAPPPALLADLTEKQGRFLTELAGKLPRIGVHRIEVKHLGESVYDITAHIENTGVLPTQLAQGGLTREVLPTRVILKTDTKNILSGQRTVMLDAIQGHAAKEVRWVVRAKGESKLDLEIVSALAGHTQTAVQLKQAQR